MTELSLLRGHTVLESEHARYWDEWIIRETGAINYIQKEYLASKATRNELVSLQLSLKGSFVAGCMLLLRRCSLNGILVKSYLVSHVIVHEEFRGLGLLRQLFEGVSVFLDNEEAIGLIVARRAVDGPYGKFGYEAFATFTTYKFKPKAHTSSFTVNTQKVGSMPIKELPVINRIYEENYKQVFLFLLREEPEWFSVFQKASSDNLSIYLIEVEHTVLGYFAIANSQVIEVALDYNFLRENTQDVISQVFHKTTHVPIRIQKTHPVISMFPDNFSLLESRKPTQGGHQWWAPSGLVDVAREANRVNEGSFISTLDEF